MSDAVARVFEQELERRGVPFRVDEESLRYVIQHRGLDVLVSLENLARMYARDPGGAHVSGFVDVILSGPSSPRSWEQARPSIPLCLEPSDHVEPPEFRRAISERVDRVLVDFDDSKGAITWIMPDMLRGWQVGADEVEAAALSNLAAILAGATIEHTDIDGVRLGMVSTTLPFKTALILAPNLKEVVSPVLGWPLHVVIPDRNFLYLWDARHTTFMQRAGGVVLDEFAKAPYPLTTEIFEISDDGITAIGAFQRAPDAV